MADARDFWTQKRSDGKWESKNEGALRASGVLDTKAEARGRSKDVARDRQGEAHRKGKDGLIHGRNTYGMIRKNPNVKYMRPGVGAITSGADRAAGKKH